MIKLSNLSEHPTNVALILGFFDGIHAGHQEVINNVPKNAKKALITFSKSPAEYFNQDFEYIYNRKKNYKLLDNLAIDYLYEIDFSEVANFSAYEYIELLIKKFSPQSITTGFNHSFGKNKTGNAKLLSEFSNNFKYYCTKPKTISNEIVSSTRIKELLKNAEIEKANKFLTRPFTLEATVIEGKQLGRKIGFPTANMKYPQKIVKIPYGVYKVEVLGKPAIMNWGIKPTFESEEIMEVHIPNFNENLYNKDLEIKFLSFIRHEIKFNSLDDLKEQIRKDILECYES